MTARRRAEFWWGACFALVPCTILSSQYHRQQYRQQYRPQSLRHALQLHCFALPLQDHFRQCVKPCFTDVYRERGEAVGVAEFETMEEMRTAIRRLDDTEFKNPFEKSYIRIVEVSTSNLEQVC